MKHKMTLEEGDLRSYVQKILAMHGVRAADTIVFRSGKGQEVTGLHIDIDCEMAPETAECPLCGLVRRRVAVVTADKANNAGVESTPSASPRVYKQESVEVDESLGESTVPPGEEDGSIVDDSESVASMASLRAASERIKREKERDQKARKKKTPRYGGGESDKPPEPGE